MYKRPLVMLVLPLLLITLFVIAGFAFTKPASAQTPTSSSHRHSQQRSYLALGDSLAYGYQPGDNRKNAGYADDLLQLLKQNGNRTNIQSLTDLGCPGETSTTFINGSCPAAPAGAPSQLAQAVQYLKDHPEVSLITLHIGANDVLGNIDPQTCTTNVEGFNQALATLDSNLKEVILPQLREARQHNGILRGKFALLNYYNAFQPLCPETSSYTQILNQHLADDAAAVDPSIKFIDIFSAFSTADNFCSLVWICDAGDIHPKDAGYQLIANILYQTLCPPRKEETANT